MMRPIHWGRWAREPRPTIGAALVAVCALVLASCESAPPSSASAEAGAAVAVHASPAAPAAAEARALADRILQRESGALLLEARRQRALSHEVERVLALIRRSHPAMADVSVREDARPATLLLALEGGLRDTVADIWGDGDLSAVPRTGHTAFDALNETLRLRAVRSYAALGAVALHLDERANIAAAIGAYEAIDGVAYAEADEALGDGSDIEAAMAGGTWHVVFRKAWGDCPSGCIEQALSFFTVEEDRVERIDSARARQTEAFAGLLSARGWRLSE